MAITTGWTWDEIVETLGDASIEWVVSESVDTPERPPSKPLILARGKSENFEAACRSAQDFLEREMKADIDGEVPTFHIFGDPGNALVLTDFTILSGNGGIPRRVTAAFCVASKSQANT